MDNIIKNTFETAINRIYSKLVKTFFGKGIEFDKNSVLNEEHEEHEETAREEGDDEGMDNEGDEYDEFSTVQDNIAILLAIQADAVNDAQCGGGTVNCDGGQTCCQGGFNCCRGGSFCCPRGRTCSNPPGRCFQNTKDASGVVTKELDNKGQEKVTPCKLFNEESGGAGLENSQTSPSVEEAGWYSSDGSFRSRRRAEYEEGPMPVWCKMFCQTLSGSARNWFDTEDPKSVDGFEELSNKFLEDLRDKGVAAGSPKDQG
nr:hypothetical protein [Tanacetum cinerariifolium]